MCTALISIAFHDTASATIPPSSFNRLPFTSTYIGSLAMTLYAAFVMQSYSLVLLFMGVQGMSEISRRDMHACASIDV